MIAVFVSPHGFGHAARASAVMEALHRLFGARFDVFASTPRWFFDESVPGLYRYHEVATDVGFRQRSALAYDLEGTARALEEFVPFDPEVLDRLAGKVVEAGCGAVLCDISPLGIAVAERAGVPSVLLESFTWPWLYEPLFAEEPRLGPLAAELQRWFERATVHVQTEPLCRRDPEADRVVPPIARPVRRGREEVRRDLGIEPDARVVVLTMGGVREPLPFLERLYGAGQITWLVTGLPKTLVARNVHAFDDATPIYMPDFIHAADAVVAKLGYSTVAEAWRSRRPLAYVSRADFRETAPLRAWVRRELEGFEIPGPDFPSGDWLERVPELLEMGAPAEDESTRQNGAETVAELTKAVGVASPR